jgi:arylsulfatase
MNRREFLKTVFAGSAAAMTTAGGISHGMGKFGNPLRGFKRPNIILIMVDDMGFSDIGCYGSEIATPNLDSLAANGLRFTQFYNAARCCPTRASLLTGLYPHQAGVGGMTDGKRGDVHPEGPYQGWLNDQCVTIAEVLKKAGYHTLMSGKWHVGETKPHWPTDRGFDRYYGLISGAANYFDITKGKWDCTFRRFAIDNKLHTPEADDFYMTTALTDNAVRFIDEYGRDDKPFFMYVAYTAPHWPLHALPEDIAKYKGKYMQGWQVLRKQRYARQIEMGIIDQKWPLTPRDDGAIPWDDVKDKELMDLKMAVYAAQIDCVDQGIGKMVEKIKALGEMDNTLILFLSDNGGCHESGPLGFDRRNNGIPPGGVDSYMSYGRSWANASNTPFRRFKKWVHEGGISTPLIAYWPAVIKNGGTITDQVGHIIDIMATCCDVAGANYPKAYRGNKIKPLEGKSLLPVFRGKKRTGHKTICWEHRGNCAIRQGRWKMVLEGGTHKWELYDMVADRTELNDQAAVKPEKVLELKNLYRDWALKAGSTRHKVWKF